VNIVEKGLKSLKFQEIDNHRVRMLYKKLYFIENVEERIKSVAYILRINKDNVKEILKEN
jgi:hypothetical protein